MRRPEPAWHPSPPSCPMSLNHPRTARHHTFPAINLRLSPPGGCRLGHSRRDQDRRRRFLVRPQSGPSYRHARSNRHQHRSPPSRSPESAAAVPIPSGSGRRAPLQNYGLSAVDNRLSNRSSPSCHPCRKTTPGPTRFAARYAPKKSPRPLGRFPPGGLETGMRCRSSSGRHLTSSGTTARSIPPPANPLPAAANTAPS